jgi:endonuclease YncB( thermonuclease family)
VLTALAGSSPAGKDKIRLYGIDAPEKTQSCTDAKGQTYSCGQASTQALQQKVGNKPLRCEVSTWGCCWAVCSLAQQHNAHLQLSRQW